jgi:hypothetical protein
MAFSAQISLSVLAHETSVSELATSLRVTPASYAQSLTNGTAGSQAQVAWSSSRTLSGSSQTFSLATLSDVRDGATVTVTMTAVKLYYVRNKGASSLAFAGAPFPAAGLTVAAGAVAMQSDPSASGMAASGVTVTGAAGGAYDIVLLGNGSVS